MFPFRTVSQTFTILAMLSFSMGFNFLKEECCAKVFYVCSTHIILITVAVINSTEHYKRVTLVECLVSFYLNSTGISQLDKLNIHDQICIKIRVKFVLSTYKITNNETHNWFYFMKFLPFSLSYYYKVNLISFILVHKWIWLCHFAQITSIFNFMYW